MAFRRIGTLLVAVHDSKSPAPEEWAAYMAECRAVEAEQGGNLEKVAALIFTDGGGPDSAQRRELGQWLNGRSARSAIVSDSILLRAIIAGVSLINPGGQKVFPPKQLKAAAAWALVPEGQVLETLKVALSLRHEVTECRVLAAVQL